MIEQFINEFFQRLGSWLWAHTIGLIDPFIGWAIEGALIILACFAAGWFFSVLRPVAGAVAISTLAFLWGFWKGENRDR